MSPEKAPTAQRQLEVAKLERRCRFFIFIYFFFMYSASVFMLPTVFNELLMGINVRILNEILSLALYMK